MPDDIDVQMQSLVLEIARLLVDNPEAVVVRPTIDGDLRQFQILCDPADTGKLIGKQGRTARSLRTLIAGISMKYQRRYIVDIAEDKSGLED